MYNERPEEIVLQHKVKISVVQILSIFIILLLTLILPIQVYESVKSSSVSVSAYSINSPNSGRVAGAADDNSKSVVEEFLGRSENQILLTTGVVLLSTGFFILIYLNRTKQKLVYPKPSPEFMAQLK